MNLFSVSTLYACFVGDYHSLFRGRNDEVWLVVSNIKLEVF